MLPLRRTLELRAAGIISGNTGHCCLLLVEEEEEQVGCWLKVKTTATTEYTYIFIRLHNYCRYVDILTVSKAMFRVYIIFEKLNNLKKIIK